MADYSMEQHREQIIQYLTECFASDILTTEEYEHRVERANAAENSTDLELVIADLKKSPRAPSPGNYPQRRPSGDITEGRDRQRVLAIMGEQDLTGNWLRKDSVLIQALMGSVSCDLRDVRLYPETKIQIYSLMAEVEIRVPEGVALISNVSPILAEIKRKDRNPESLPGAPVIEIGGLAIMSEVKIVS